MGEKAMRGMIRRLVGKIALGAVVAPWFLVPQAQASTILVKPGKLDHFVVTAQPTALAGESFLVRIEPFDASNNLITEFRGKGGTFSVKASGGGEVAPARLRAEEFAGGATVKVTDKRAEVLELSVTEGDAATALASVQVRILPNRLDRFVVNAPREVTAGEVFQARVIAQDAFGNTKTDLPDLRDNLRVEVTGAGTASLADKALPAFRGGEAMISFQPRKVGKLRIGVQDLKTRSQGESPAVQVNPARLDHFTLLVPKGAVAGEKFVVLVSAYDAFENLVTAYQSQGEGALFQASGTGVLSPTALAAREFVNGQARVTFSYTRAEPLRISAREDNRQVSGQSEAILVSPADPDHFRVNTPAEAVAGESFAVQIEALDRFGNLIEDYDLRGLEVYLTSDGKGQMTPPAVSASAFLKGKANVNVTYSRAESFTIVAGLSREALDKLLVDRRRQGATPPEPELTAEDRARDQERAAAAKAREEAQKAREEAEKKRPRDEAVRAREEATRAREEALKAGAAPKQPVPQKPAQKKEEPPKAEPPKVEPPKVEAPKAEPPKAEPPKPAPPKVEAPKPEPVKVEAPKAPPKVETAKAEPPKPEPPKAGAAPAAGSGKPGAVPPVQVARSATKELSSVQLEETAGQSILRLATTGPVSYNATTGSALSKEWIWLELFPIRRGSAVGERVQIDSRFLGQVLVDQVEPEKVKISLQVLLPGISYVVYQQDRAVVVKIVKAE
jgi:hypothetical protein